VGGAVIDWFGPVLAANLIRIFWGPFPATVAAVVAFAWQLWNVYLEGTTGRSVGKSLFGLVLVGEQTGEPIGFGRAVLRKLAHVIDALICYVGFLLPLGDLKRQTLADKVVHTLVFKVT
jgi:hypothetical protein